MRHEPFKFLTWSCVVHTSPSSETSFSKSNRGPILVQGHGRREARLRINHTRGICMPSPLTNDHIRSAHDDVVERVYPA